MPSKSKIISVSFKINDLSQSPEQAGNSSAETLRQNLLEKYQSDVGILDAFVDENNIVLQWFPENTDETAEEHHRKATLFAKQKNYQAAIENWKNANSINPSDVEYLYKLGLVLFEIKSYLEAIKYLEQAIRICPIHARAHLILGMSWIKLRKFEKAEAAILNSLQLNNVNLLTYLNLGAVYTVLKKFADAITTFNQALEKYPNEARAYLGLAKVYSAQSNTAEANTNYKKVIELAPSSSMAEYAKKSIRDIHSDLQEIQQSDAVKTDETLLEYGFNYFIQNKHNESSKEYKEYLKNKPSDDYVWYLYGESRLRTGQIEEAIDCFKRSLRLNDKRGLYYKMLGIALYYAEKGEECLKVLKKSIELGKDDSLTQTLLGICYLQKKQTDLAIDLFNQALKKFSNNYLAIYNLALAKIEKNDLEKAKELLESVIKTKMDIPVKESAEQTLQTLS